MAWRMNPTQAAPGDLVVGRGFLLLVAITTIAGIALAVWMMLRKGTGVPVAFDAIEQVLGRVLQIILGVAAGGVVAGAAWMISHMDAGSRSQGGNLFVTIGAVVALACLAGMYVSVERRLKK